MQSLFTLGTFLNFLGAGVLVRGILSYQVDDPSGWAMTDERE